MIQKSLTILTTPPKINESNLKMMVLMICFFQGSIIMFHVDLPGCKPFAYMLSLKRKNTSELRILNKLHHILFSWQKHIILAWRTKRVS